MKLDGKTIYAQSSDSMKSSCLLALTQIVCFAKTSFMLEPLGNTTLNKEKICQEHYKIER